MDIKTFLDFWIINFRADKVSELEYLKVQLEQQIIDQFINTQDDNNEKNNILERYHRTLTSLIHLLSCQIDSYSLFSTTQILLV